MNPPVRIMLLLAAGLAVAARLVAAETPAVAASAARQARLDAVRGLLAPKTAIPLAGLVDPFHPAAFAELVAARSPAAGAGAEGAADAKTASGPRTDHDILAAIANNLRPKAVFMGGGAFLFFGEKRTKVGDPLILTYEGTVYQVQITAIDRNTFTLRLNREEYTRPIKQGTAP